MCYSAQCWAHWRKYQKEFNARISIREFAALFGYKRRAAATGEKIYTPKGLDDSFRDPRSEDEAAVWRIIEELNDGQKHHWEERLFSQRKRRTEAQRKLDVKVTKTAEKELRIAGSMIEQAEGKLADLRRTTAEPDDGRIFPFWWAPVMVLEAGELVVKPMRYHCRLDGWHAGMEAKYGTYNARRDSFSDTWRKQFGYQHGVMVVNRFWENVWRHDYEHRELRPGEQKENLRLEFDPTPAHDMLVACLWHRSRGFGDELPEFYSFAAITDEPPAEVAAAGHDRCIVPIKPENMMRWLAPAPSRLNELQAILEDRDRPYYEHQVERKAA